MEEREVMFTIGFVTILLLLLLGFLFFFLIKYRVRKNRFIEERENMKKDFNQMLLQSQVEVQEDTFSALAKELHDNVGQLLSSSKMLLGITQRNMNDIPETLTVAEETLGNAITELRSLSKSLDREWLQQFDLIDNLTTEIKRINSGLILKIHFIHENKLLLPADEQIILFRIIQEALQNAIKHSEAKNISIAITTKEDHITVTIADDGKGFETTMSKGLGIRNMTHRVRLLHGTITWSNLQPGSLITIELPVKESSNENQDRNS